MHKDYSFCPIKCQCPQAKTLQAKGLHFYPDVPLPGSAIDMITRLTEGNQPCNRHILSSSLSSGPLVSSHAKSAVIIMGKPTTSVFFPAHTTACLIPVPLCTCSFAGRDLNLAAWMQAVCAPVSMSVWFIYYSSRCSSASQNSSTEPSTAHARGHGPGEQKKQVQASSPLLLRCRASFLAKSGT